MQNKTPQLILAACNNAHNDCHELVKLLLNAGAEVNARDKDQTTALILAAWHNNPKVVNLLLAAGADINLTNIYGDSAINCAGGALSNNLSMVDGTISRPTEEEMGLERIKQGTRATLGNAAISPKKNANLNTKDGVTEIPTEYVGCTQFITQSPLASKIKG